MIVRNLQCDFFLYVQITLLLHRVPRGSSGPPAWLTGNSMSLPDTTPSDSSEASSSEEGSNEEDDWDSGECSIASVTRGNADEH